MKRSIYLFSLFLFYSYTILYVFLMVFSALAFLEYKYGVNIPFIEIYNSRPKIHVPILGWRINAPVNISVLLMWISMSFYAVYFYFVKEFAKIFVKSNIFEAKSLKCLRSFLILNLLPLIYIIILVISILVKDANFRLEDDYFIVLAHIIIAFLIYLYLDILKKGRNVQEENELTI